MTLNTNNQKIWTLDRGIHPQENKVQSLTSPIIFPTLPDSLCIAISQPDFQAPEVLVKVGDSVLKGQIIARGKSINGLTYHASSSGIVEAISPMPVPNHSGIDDYCIKIKTDGKDEWLAHCGEEDFLSLSRKELIHLITEAGISGLGGAGFPTHRKITAADKDIQTLIINACECEPFITADDALMRERADDIIKGIKILLHLLKPKQCFVGIEDNKPEALTALTRANDDDRIKFIIVPTKYPSGAEKQLVQILTGKQIATGTLAIDSGILCQNIATAYAISRAIIYGEPLISRITTLTGAALESPCNVEALIGTPISHLLNSCGLKTDIFSNLIMGGSLMGINLSSTGLPVLKTSTCFIATTEMELPHNVPAQACIRCGLCVEACPVGLLPQQLYWFARSKEHEKAQQHNIMDCIECGACAYVCPSHIPLVQYYRASKSSIRDEESLHTKAAHSQLRFETRELRMEKDKAIADKRREERAELARKNREAKASNNETSLDPIQAALARIKAKKQ